MKSDDQGLINKKKEIQNRQTYLVDWENEIKIVFTLVSVLSFLLLVIKIISITSTKDINEPLLSIVTIIPIIVAFLVGIFYTFYQIRVINQRRQKNTSIGGNILIIGLILSVTPLIRAEFLSSKNDSYYNYILVIGVTF